MELKLSRKHFRHLLDMAYIGNWILNSARGEDRITEYDEVESILFETALKNDMTSLAVNTPGEGPQGRTYPPRAMLNRTSRVFPSREFIEGGIHEAIMDYEDTVFFEILAEELARRDMIDEAIDPDNVAELNDRISEYISEFERNGTDNITVNS